MKHNIYYDGKVQSLGLNTDEGYATVGVITPGSYTFSTDFEEHVTIITGTLKVKLPDEDWRGVEKGEKYIVAPKFSFEVIADKHVSYICYYKK